IRISLVLIAYNKQWDIPLSLEHHTLFNIIVYACIFFMIWIFQRTETQPKIDAAI
ncbi:MAG: hypothetical protein H0V14_09115, partial [Chitinophagaceae bacterium]|nr:hypothetical protein [Chitinophagaceae bacterium]